MFEDVGLCLQGIDYLSFKLCADLEKTAESADQMYQSINIFLLHGIEIIGKISILVSALNSLCCQRRLKSQCLKNFIKEMLSRRCCLLREKYINQGWSVFSVCQQARAVSWWLASFVYSRFPCCTDKLSWAINSSLDSKGLVGIFVIFHWDSASVA